MPKPWKLPSCTKCRSIQSRVAPSSRVTMECASHSFANRVLGACIRASPPGPGAPPVALTRARLHVLWIGQLAAEDHPGSTMDRLDLRARLAAPTPLLCPGVYDALSAALVEQAGFEAAYLSGASIAYTRLGAPDIGLVSMTEVADVLACVTRARAPAGDRRCGYRVRQRAQRAAHGARAGARGRCGDPARGSGLSRSAAAICATRRWCRPPRWSARSVRPWMRDDRALIIARTDAIAVEGFDAGARARGTLSGGRRRHPLRRGAGESSRRCRPSRDASPAASRCWPTWSRAGARRSPRRTSSARSASASSSSRAAPCVR